MINIGIIENNACLRDNLAKYFNNQQEMRCHLAVDNTNSFFERTSSLSHPHVVLHTVLSKDKAAYQGIHRIKTAFPNTQVITISSEQDTDSILKALYAGASSYLSKGIALTKIKEAIVDTYQGNSALSPSVARKLVEHFKPKTSKKSLTPKETQIVQCLCDGLSYKMTADKLLISINTLNYHIKNIYRKLNVNSKAEVLRMRMQGEC